ncbi:uncharacterized protein AAEQ78_028190 [Lycaon pictus]
MPLQEAARGADGSPGHLTRAGLHLPAYDTADQVRRSHVPRELLTEPLAVRSLNPLRVESGVWGASAAPDRKAGGRGPAHAAPRLPGACSSDRTPPAAHFRSWRPRRGRAAGVAPGRLLRHGLRGSGFRLPFHHVHVGLQQETPATPTAWGSRGAGVGGTRRGSGGRRGLVFVATPVMSQEETGLADQKIGAPGGHDSSARTLRLVSRVLRPSRSGGHQPPQGIGGPCRAGAICGCGHERPSRPLVLPCHPPPGGALPASPLLRASWSPREGGGRQGLAPRLLPQARPSGVGLERSARRTGKARQTPIKNKK